MQKLLFLIMSPSFHAEVVILLHFNFLLCRSCYSRLFHLPLMERLLFLLMSPSSNAEVVIFVYFIFFPWRSCYSRSLHLPPMQKLLFSFISNFSTAVVIPVDYTFAPCRSCFFVHFTFLQC